MTVYNDALWTEASHDHEAAHDAEVMGAAQVAGSEVWSVLASAESESDFYTRLALLHDRLHAVAASIAPEGTPDYTRVVTALPERYFEDWHILAEARRVEAQRQNAPRAAARNLQREQKAAVGSSVTCFHCHQPIGPGDPGFKPEWGDVQIHDGCIAAHEAEREAEGLAAHQKWWDAMEPDFRKGYEDMGFTRDKRKIGSKAITGTASQKMAADELDQAILDHAQSDGGTIKADDKIGRWTVTEVGTHTIQVKTDDGYEGSRQIPFIDPQGNSYPSHQRALSRKTAYQTGEGWSGDYWGIFWQGEYGDGYVWYVTPEKWVDDHPGTIEGGPEASLELAKAKVRAGLLELGVPGDPDHPTNHSTHTRAFEGSLSGLASQKVAYTADAHRLLTVAYHELTGHHLVTDHDATTIAYVLNRVEVEKALTLLAKDKGHVFSVHDTLQALDKAYQKAPHLDGPVQASLASVFSAASSESADFMTPEGAPEARPMEEAIKDPALDEADPVTWDKTAVARDADCAVCRHPLWWNEERGEYVHRPEYGADGHKPEPVQADDDEHYHDDPQPYPYYNAACPNCGGDHAGQCPYPWIAQHDASKAAASNSAADTLYPEMTEAQRSALVKEFGNFVQRTKRPYEQSRGMSEAVHAFTYEYKGDIPMQVVIDFLGDKRRSASKRTAGGDNSWPPKEGGEKEGGDPKAPPAAPGAPQVPQPTPTEQAQPGQPGTPASGITTGTVLLDAADGMVATYEVSNVVDEGETMLVSVTKNGGEQMDLRIPKTEMVQAYQAKGDQAAAPVEQPAGDPAAANPFADKAAAEGEAKPEEGADKAPADGDAEKPKAEGEAKPDEDDPEKKKGNPFA